MSPAVISALGTAAASVLVALAGLVKALRTQSNLDAHVNDPKAHQ